MFWYWVPRINAIVDVSREDMVFNFSLMLYLKMYVLTMRAASALVTLHAQI